MAGRVRISEEKARQQLEEALAIAQYHNEKDNGTTMTVRQDADGNIRFLTTKNDSREHVTVDPAPDRR